MTLQATLTSGGSAVAGRSVSFSLNGNAVGSATTDASGVATLSASLNTISVGSYPASVSATFAGDSSYTASSGNAALSVAKATATVTISDATVTYDGSPKSLTATTTPAGLSLTYSASATDAGIYPVTATVDDPNYSGSATATLTIQKATATFTLSGLSTTYDGTPQAVGVSTTPAGLASVTITYDGSSTVPTNAGSYPVAVSLDNPNYSGSATATLTIAKAAATLSLSNLTQGYDGSGKAATVTTSPPDLAGVSVTYAGGSLPINVGSYPVHATLDNPNYSAPAIDDTLAIVSANQTISFAALADKTYGDAAFAVSATASSGLPISFSAAGACSLSGSTVTITGAGSCTISASQAGDSNYTAAPTVDHTFSIAKAAATISLSDATVIYTGSPQAVTASITPVGTTGLSVTYDGLSAAPANAGSYTVLAHLDNPNYAAADVSATLTITKATATISLADTTVTYDGSAHAVMASTDPTSLAGLTVTYDGSTTAPTNAGSYSLVASLSNPNYTAASVTRTLTINKAAATISLSDLSAAYDGSAHAVTASTDPASLAGLTVTYDGSATAPTNAGSYSLVASLSNPNYTAASVTRTLTIAKAPAMVTISDASFTYDGTPKALTATTTPAGLSLTYSASATNAGSYPVTATVSDPNYSGSATATLTITKATATISMADASVTYTGTPKALTATITPASLSGGLAVTYDGSTTAPTNRGTYSVVASLTDPNYSAASVTRTLVINGLSQSLTFAPLAGKTYGNAPFTVSATASSGLPITFSASGTCSIAGSTVTLDGAGSCNITASQPGSGAYSPASSVTQTFSIAKANQTITFAAPANRAYSPTPFALTATSSSSLAVSYTASGPCTVAGSQLTTTAAGTCNVTALQSGDANFNPAASIPRSFTITKAAQTITFAAPANRAFSPTPFAISPTASSGLPVTVVSTTPTICTIAGSQVTMVGIGTCSLTASQPGDAAYNAATSVVRSFTISKAAQTITFAALPGKTYGDPAFAVSATSSSGLAVNFSTSGPCFYNGSVVTITGAGTCTVTASQAGNTFYNAAANVARAVTIAKAAATVSISNLSQSYTGTTRPVNVTTNPAGLPVTVTYNGSATVPTNAGSYTVVATINHPNYAGSATATLVVAKANQTISFGTLANRAFSTTAFTLTATSSSGLAITYTAAGQCTVTTNRVTMTARGTCSITANQAGNVNYNAALPVTQSFTIQ